MQAITFRKEGEGEDRCYIGETKNGIAYWVAFWPWDGWAFGACDANDQDLANGHGIRTKREAVAGLRMALAGL